MKKAVETHPDAHARLTMLTQMHQRAKQKSQTCDEVEPSAEAAKHESAGEERPSGVK